MKKFRVVFLLMLFMGLAFITTVSIQHPVQPPFPYSFSILFQAMGKPIKSIDRGISCLLPIDEMDEKHLGEQIKLQLAEHALQDEKMNKYLNSLLDSFRDEIHKPFRYRVFLMEGPPNAWAMPGGLICITTQLMNLLENEAELVAILAHELGHIELGHLFDATREELLMRKITKDYEQIYISSLLNIMTHLAYNKSQEEEADDYSFRLLVKKQYDPFAISTVFKKLGCTYINKSESSLITDFMRTHPHIEHREEKFTSRALIWKAHTPDQKWYTGEKNFASRISHADLDYPDEWK